MAFHPEEVLFSATTKCNLACPHCDLAGSKAYLSASLARKFLVDCKKNGIKRIGFTGGEPFLAPDFLYSVTRFAVKNGFLFTRIMTNGVWYKNSRDLKATLQKLFKAGYDGSICLSVDAYHKQDVEKLAFFIKSVRSLWRRPDMISIVYVTGRETATKEKISRLAGLLNGRAFGFRSAHSHIRSADLFIKIGKIDISPIGKAGRLAKAWGGKWFKEDYCKGPGNVFFIEPSGEVKPCCGYASGSDALSIGNIRTDSVNRIIKNIRQNRFVCDIFNYGLSSMRDKLSKHGLRFPGKAGNNCFFCHYLLTEIPRGLISEVLKR